MSDERWLRELFDANYKYLYRLASNRLRAELGHSEDAEDVLQEVFLIAQRKNIRDHENPVGWLTKAMGHTCDNYIRADRRYARRQRRCAERMKLNCTRHALLFVEKGDDETKASDINITLEQSLPPEELDLLRKYYEQRDQLALLAEREGMTVNALRVKIHRIRKKLEEILK